VSLSIWAVVYSSVLRTLNSVKGPVAPATLSGEEAMTSNFTKRWMGTGRGPPLSVRIRNSIRPPPPLKERMSKVSRRMDTQIKRMDKTLKKFQTRHKQLFNQVVESLMHRDMERANALANELSQMKNIIRLITYSKLALEQVSLRLKTITEVGNMVSTLAPALQVLQSVRYTLGNIIPDAEKELGEINDLLTDIISSAGQFSETSVDFEASSEEAQRILREAMVIAESRMKDSFPELPDELMDEESRSGVYR